jgi:cell wall assembly regulator SMI1
MVLTERFNNGPIKSIEGLWQRIEAWMQRHAPERWQQLAPGATEEAIKHLETVLDITLPDDVRASYQRHDGGYMIKLGKISRHVLPIMSIIDYWHMLMECLEMEDWATLPPDYYTNEVLRSGLQPVIQLVHWHQRWIPFAESAGASNFWCLDLEPAPGGLIGQIIEWDHECGPDSQALLPSFHHLLSAYADQLEDISHEESQ